MKSLACPTMGLSTAIRLMLRRLEQCLTLDGRRSMRCVSCSLYKRELANALTSLLGFELPFEHSLVDPFGEGGGTPKTIVAGEVARSSIAGVVGRSTDAGVTGRAGVAGLMLLPRAFVELVDAPRAC